MTCRHRYTGWLAWPSVISINGWIHYPGGGTRQGGSSGSTIHQVYRVNMSCNEVAGTPTLIQLQDPLDEPEYYCIDVPGFGASLDLTSALSVHTCKPHADDELFTVNSPAPGQIYMAAYDLCIQADSVEAGARLYLKICSASPLQQFDVTDEAQLRLQTPGSEVVCVAVASGQGQPTGGPSHLRRDLMLQPCRQVEAGLSQWVITGSSDIITTVGD